MRTDEPQKSSELHEKLMAETEGFETRLTTSWAFALDLRWPFFRGKTRNLGQPISPPLVSIGSDLAQMWA